MKDVYAQHNVLGRLLSLARSVTVVMFLEQKRSNICRCVFVQRQINRCWVSDSPIVNVSIFVPVSQLNVFESEHSIGNFDGTCE